jgi:hypothetical protein
VNRNILFLLTLLSLILFTRNGPAQGVVARPTSPIDTYSDGNLAFRYTPSGGMRNKTAHFQMQIQDQERSCGSARGAISDGRPYRDRQVVSLHRLWAS